MTSERNNARLLDAAREVVLTVGLRRATLTDVARRAGVSRMTVYRAFPDMQSVLAELMTREWLAEVQPAADAMGPDAGAAETLGHRFVATVSALRANPLFRRIVDVDPEHLLPYLIHRRGRTQDFVLGLLTERIEAGQATGELRDGDPALLARTMLLAAHGFALSAQTMTTDGLTQADLDAELVHLIQRYVSP